MFEPCPNVFVHVSWQGCNVSFVKTSEGVVMFDTPQNPTNALQWRTQIAEKGPLSYLINTEHHGDHIMGNYFFDTTVVSHQGTKDQFLASLGPLDQMKERIKMMDPEGVALVENYVPRPPTVTYTERMNLYLGSHTFQLMNLPGHTPNETVIYVPEARTVFTGDNVVYRTHPYLHQADVFGWLESLKVIESLDVDVVVPGHGRVCGKDGIKEMSALLEEIIATVRRAKDSGVSREEVGDKVSFIDRFPVDPARAAMMEQVMKNNMMRVYDQV